jgi:endoglucanase
VATKPPSPHRRALAFLPLALAAAVGSGPEPEAAARADVPTVPVELRLSQIGYRPRDAKSAVAFSASPLPDHFSVRDATGDGIAFEGAARRVPGGWGTFAHHAELDFTPLRRPGRYVLAFGAARSRHFLIDEGAGKDVPDFLLEYLRQQRCGYNPWLDAVCHPYDGRTAYGPPPEGRYLDARGGWHDAGDLLKYLLTSSTAIAHLLLAYTVAPGAFSDRVNALGQAGTNGVPDVLDEARWGLEWLLRLHPAPGELYHQVADDRDHSGWRLPQDESTDYGWGPGRYRVVYFADGSAQGLKEYKSESTGVANLAGRYAAAMALAHRVWKDDPAHAPFARRCLRAGIEVYRLGKDREGVQQGNSYGSPYRYAESTWADDMEWGAAELFRATAEPGYLRDARRYAEAIGSTSWMGREKAGHYEFYPFLNAGHFALHGLVEPAYRRKLAGYYREGIEACRRAGASNPYAVGVPFIWCSNNLVVALATQCRLYERMTGDIGYRGFAASQRDWLLGRNPWGTSMITGIPEDGVFPRDVHLMTTQLTRRAVRGGLVDGPVGEPIFRGLKGVTIREPDPLAAFQDPRAVYHDDVGDYSTNEPTMDGTASAVLLWALEAASGLEPPR